MSETEDYSLAEAMRRVAEAPTDNFVELVRLAGLDPARHMRFCDWSKVDFGGCDLKGGFDFSGARLRDCRFQGSRISGARFDKADISGSNIRQAADWADFVKSWKKSSDPVSDSHLRRGAVFQDAPFAPEMVVIPPGRFWMGSRGGERDAGEWPRHEVIVPRALAVGRYPVTFAEWDFAQADAEWRKIAGMKPREPEDQGWGRGSRPAIRVSWEDAQAYTRWLSHKTGQAYRLLSEAEWEYACRAGSETAYCFGNEESGLEQHAWYSSNSGGKTHPVGAKAANGFGLHDMHGNVWEWCEDCWNDSYRDKPERLKANGAAWTSGDCSSRVIRGGSWGNGPGDLRAAIRGRDDAENRDGSGGFRVARTLTS